MPGNKTGFQPYTITVPSLYETNTVFSVKQSRFTFTAYGISDRQNRQLKASIEIDFANSATYAPRLQHAYIQHGKWLFGQTWANFMDDNIWPNVMDAQGSQASYPTQSARMFYQPVFHTPLPASGLFFYFYNCPCPLKCYIPVRNC